jgi:DNA-directed RNA polymerase specialized sigma subunit
MTDNAEKLFNDNIGLSNFAVTTYKYYIAGYDFDDLLQLARLTLWQAALDYDPSRGVEFSAYAVRSIHNELVKLIIKDQCSKRSKYTEVLAGAILIDDSDGYLLTEAKPSIDNVENEVECRVMLDAVLRSLDKESLYIIR